MHDDGSNLPVKLSHSIDMKHGICKLCLGEADLCNSHYLGKALYALLQTEGEQPVFVSPSRVVQTSLQISDYLLCEQCEQRFSRGGERYAHSLMSRHGNFKLLDAVRSIKRRRFEGELTVFSALDINVDTESLAYYALSVIWRGGVHTWRTFKGTATGDLKLGVHQEPIRKYLLGVAPFPPGVFVKVSVGTDFQSQNSAKFPEVNPDQPDAAVYTFYALGLWYDVVAGEDLPPYMITSCCVSSPERPIFKGDFGKYVELDCAPALSSARIHGRLRPQ